MQVARLFEIVFLLLSNESMTASKLAAHFEVSARTIYRDIDTLSAAGIPVFCEKGRGGGIRLLPGFTMKQAYLTKEERENTLSALQAFRAARVPDTDAVLHKLGGLFKQQMPDWIAVEFLPWGAGNDQKFFAIKEAILAQCVITFYYYNTKGEKKLRSAEPYQLWYKDRAWYLKAYCLEKSAPRLFKLNRMREVTATAQKCRHFDVEIPEQMPNTAMPPLIRLKLRLRERLSYRVYDEFEDAQVKKLNDGSFLIEALMIEDQWLYGYLLTFGVDMTIVEPEQVRQRMKAHVEQIYEKYVLES